MLSIKIIKANKVFDNYIPFYLKIINKMMILPPIIISVLTSKFFTESIRLETFVVIPIVGLDSDVWVVVVVVDGRKRCVGHRHWSVLIRKSCHCVFWVPFNTSGNSVPGLSGLFGTVRDCSGTVRGLFGFVQGCVGPPGGLRDCTRTIRDCSGLNP